MVHSKNVRGLNVELDWSVWAVWMSLTLVEDAGSLPGHARLPSILKSKKYVGCLSLIHRTPHGRRWSARDRQFISLETLPRGKAEGEETLKSFKRVVSPLSAL
jgi:hypothetical protein